jgi:GDPmannose 4,6-dehydratase
MKIINKHMKKIALIFGITGQDGSYLAELLINKGYIVHGVKRRSSSFNTSRIDHIYQDPHEKNKNFLLHYGDVTDAISVSTLIKKIKPNEIYNLAAQSHVSVSFEVPEYTANADAIGALRILEAIKFHGFEKKTKFYQAGTSEMFGKVQEIPQTEKTPFYPRSPYGVAKVYAHWITVNYRECYKIFACNGILFNHESPRRGETFVTRKIVIGLCKIKLGLQKKLFLGNLDAKRDWGHAKDYVEAMWKMLQRKNPSDYVIATGKQYSVKEFINLTLKELKINYYWKGQGIKSKCFDENGNCIIECDKEYFRPLEVDTLLGNANKAFRELKWRPKIHIKELVKEMVDNELLSLNNDK